MRNDISRVKNRVLDLVVEETEPRGRPKLEWLDKIEADLSRRCARRDRMEKIAMSDPREIRASNMNKNYN